MMAKIGIIAEAQVGNPETKYHILETLINQTFYLTYTSSPDDVALDLRFTLFCVVSLLGVVALLCVFEVLCVVAWVEKEVARESPDTCLSCTDDEAIVLPVETNCVVLLAFSISVVCVPEMRGLNQVKLEYGLMQSEFTLDNCNGNCDI